MERLLRSKAQCETTTTCETSALREREERTIVEKGDDANVALSQPPEEALLGVVEPDVAI